MPFQVAPRFFFFQTSHYLFTHHTQEYLTDLLQVKKPAQNGQGHRVTHRTNAGKGPCFRVRLRNSYSWRPLSIPVASCPSVIKDADSQLLPPPNRNLLFTYHGGPQTGACIMSLPSPLFPKTWHRANKWFCSGGHKRGIRKHRFKVGIGTQLHLLGN